MDSMVEKVAEAIFLSKNGGAGSWRRLHPEVHKFYSILARAAIEAMREPTPIMIQDGQVIAPFMPDIIQRCWQSMIDAALENPKAPEPPA